MRPRLLYAAAPNARERRYLKIIHSVGQRDNEAGVIGDGFVAEDDIDAVVQVSEVLFCGGKFTVVILGVIPVEDETRPQPFYAKAGRQEVLQGKEVCPMFAFCVTFRENPRQWSRNGYISTISLSRTTPCALLESQRSSSQ